MKTLPAIFLLTYIICQTCQCSLAQADSSELHWKKIDDGLLTAEYTLPKKSSHGNSTVVVLKIDPAKYKFKLISAGQQNVNSQKAPDWAAKEKVIGVFNTGMFKLDGDFKTSTGFMKSYSYVNNPNLNPAYKNIFAFNVDATTLPAAQLIDLSCDDWENLKKSYSSFSQGIRMIDCSEKPTWQASPKKWSMVTIAQNNANEILVLFVRSPYEVRDYTKMIMESPLKVTRMMYLEGGPEASLYVNHNNVKIACMGSYETGFNESDNNSVFWDIPNVIGIVKK